VWRQAQDRKILKRINTLLQDVARNGNEGIGKPEPLKHEIRIAACRYHYGD
jgi:toxin YoeB